MRRRALFALVMLTLAVLGLVACTPEEQADPMAIQAAEDLAWLKENKPLLDGHRQELQELRDRLAGKIPEAEGEGEAAEPPQTPEELESMATELTNKIDTLAADVAQKVVSFLNNSDIDVGAELTEDQKYAVNAKIGEDIVTAQEYIDKGGDYARALDIYKMSKQLDPNNEMLVAAIASAEELRWVTEERFKQAKKGMTQDEVREILGTVHHSNVRDFPDRNAVGWFYKKQGGGAAGIYFRENKGDWKAYSLDFNAIKQQVIESGAEG